MPERMAFNKTRQGVRDLDRVEGYVVPYSLDPHAASPQKNVGSSERVVSGIAGGAMALLGLSRRSVPGLALAVAGGALLYRALGGHCPMYQALGMNTHAPAAGESKEELVYRY